MAETSTEAAFAYHEPSIKTFLNQAGFLIVLNIVNFCLDRLLYCGLIGQLLVGILWGTPGAKWLDRETETVIQQLGYLGLILLVYEGGLSTSIKSVRANLLVSLCVAITGIGMPMGLSFILKELVGANSLQAFAAGAALSATSLGTTFTILSTTNLITTRLGTVTTSAAMLDDVIGLVMVQIISNLGGNGTSFNAVTVIRPLFVSFGFAVGLFLICAFVIGPCLEKVLRTNISLPEFTKTWHFIFLVHTILLVGIVAGATCAGTSSLFAAYLSGVMVTWLDEKIADSQAPGSNAQNASGSEGRDSDQSVRSGPSEQPSVHDSGMPTGEKVYEAYFKQPANRILIPLFFASIGFAIPITEMFRGNVVWRGIIYSLLMIFGKMVTGLWLVRFSSQPFFNFFNSTKSLLSRFRLICSPRRSKKQKREKDQIAQSSAVLQSDVRTEASHDNTTRNRIINTADAIQESDSGGDTPEQPKAQETREAERPSQRSAVSFPEKPKSLYPPSILGLAMVARGEVGYLIASLAQSQDMFSRGSSSETSDIYLVIIWAISICTLVGPICVGTLVKRVKRLQNDRGNSGPDPLGVWGI